MPVSSNTNNFFTHCTGTFLEAKEALLELLKNKDKIIRQDSGAKELFGFAEDINNLVSKDNKEFNSVFQSLTRFLNKNLISKYLQNPANPDLKRELVRQLLFVYAGLGQPLAIEVYNPEELRQIAVGEKTDFEDSVLARTLGKLLVGELATEVEVPLLLGFLQMNGGKETREQMDWKTAYVLALVLHTLWHYFPFLVEEAQQILMENYLYASISAGVPVFQILQNHLLTIDATSTENVFDSLSENVEEMPMDFEFKEWVAVIDIAKRYYASLAGKDPDAFTREQFIKDFYQNNPNRDIMRTWMREVLEVYLFL